MSHLVGQHCETGGRKGARILDGWAEFVLRAGSDLGTSGWYDVTQETVDGFAQVTGDRQRIHVDPVRAASGPFGITIAHGYVTLLPLPVLMEDVFPVDASPRRSTTASAE